MRLNSRLMSLTSLAVGVAVVAGACSSAAPTDTPGSAVQGTTATPAMSGLVAGQYTFQLEVTDEAEATDTDSVNVGVVNTDAAYRITGLSASTLALLGPQLMYGHAPWTWFDSRHKALADPSSGGEERPAIRHDIMSCLKVEWLT